MVEEKDHMLPYVLLERLTYTVVSRTDQNLRRLTRIWISLDILTEWLYKVWSVLTMFI